METIQLTVNYQEPGDTGEKGWSPVYSEVRHGNGSALKLTSWVGGQGTAPTSFIGMYVSANGLVQEIEDASLFGLTGLKGDKPAHQWSGTSLRFENPDGTLGTPVNLKGEKGDTLTASFQINSNGELIVTTN